MEDFKDEINKVDETDFERMSVPVMKQDDLNALDEAERTLEEEVDIDPFYNQLKSIIISKPKAKLIAEEDIQIFPDETLEALSNSPKGRRSNDKLKKEKEDLEKAQEKQQNAIFKKLPKEKETKKKEEKVKDKKKFNDKAAKQALAMSAYDSHFSLKEDKKKLKEEAKAAKAAAKEQDRLAKENAKTEKKNIARSAEIDRLKNARKEERDEQIRADVLNIAPVMKNVKTDEGNSTENVATNAEFNPFEVAPIFRNIDSASSESVEEETTQISPSENTASEHGNAAAVNENVNLKDANKDANIQEEPKLDLGVGTCVAFDTHGESIEDIAYNNMYVPAEIVYDEFGNPDIVQTMNVLVFDRGSEGEIAHEVDTTAKIVRRGLDENENLFVTVNDNSSSNVETENVAGISAVAENDDNTSASENNEMNDNSEKPLNALEDVQNVQTENDGLDMSAWLSGAEEIKPENNETSESEETSKNEETSENEFVENAENVAIDDDFAGEDKSAESVAAVLVADEIVAESKNETVETEISEGQNLSESDSTNVNEDIEQFNLTNLDEEAKNSIIKTESTEISAEVPFETSVSQTVKPQGESSIFNADASREENKIKNSEDAALASFHNEIADYERAINEGAKAVKEAKAESGVSVTKRNESGEDNVSNVSTDKACKKIEQIISGEDDDSNWRNAMDKVDENGVVIAPSMAKLAKLPQIIDYFISLKLKRDSYVKIANFLTMAYKKFEKSPENLKYVEMSIKKIIPCLMTK